MKKDSNNDGNPLTSTTCDQCSLWVEAIYIVRPYKSEVLWGKNMATCLGDGGLIYAGGESCDTKLVVAIREEITMNVFFFCLGLVHQAEKENIHSKLVPGCDSEFVVL